jgi:VanZ family protein
MGVVWFLSSIPVAPDRTMKGVFIPTVIQKGMHVVVYAFLCCLWLWVLDAGVTVAAGASAVCLTTLYAAVDEFHQTFVPGRFGSPVDVGLDAMAASLAVVVLRVVVEWRSPPSEVGVPPETLS